MVPITMLSCVTPPAMMPGMPSVTRRRMPSVIRGRRSFSEKSLRLTPSSSSQKLQNAGDEDAQRLHDAAIGIVVIAEPDPAEIAAVSVRLSTIETDELSTNLPNVLSTPESSATSDMHIR